jgi:hypothetical protein
MAVMEDVMSDREPAPPLTRPPYPQVGYLPMMLFTAWWNAVLDAWCPACPREAVASDAHDLNVPKQIEDTGEHALFA